MDSLSAVVLTRTWRRLQASPAAADAAAAADHLKARDDGASFQQLSAGH